MADFTLDDACTALAVAVANVPGLRAKAFVDNEINVPEAHVFERDYDPRLTLGGSPKSAYQLGVRVFVSTNSMRTAQQTMRGYRQPSGTTSLQAQIENGDAWDVDIDHAVVTNIGQPFMFEHTSGVYWCCDWDVEVVF